ncbi:MAG TPA: non-canonical purine NTP pyrophosphatase [Candidatus Saccharimonadales bacterium]|nr:non-canonical purine NTP pyrophosphatase [Candidatus Saccharimonadales bacterium]
MKYTFITGNANKAKYVAQWLGQEVPHHKLDLDEIQTFDLHQLVEHKARQAYGILKKPVMIEDAQLAFAALGRLPGPFIKWFVQELGPQGVADILTGFHDRSASGVCCYALFDGKNLRFFEGEMHGSIAHEARGTGGFGFDPIFINDGYTITRAEMSEAEYAKTSYRKKALDKLVAYLKAEAK